MRLHAGCGEAVQGTFLAEGGDAIMVSDTTVRSNTEIVREYVHRVFNNHELDQVSAYLAPEVKWHGGTLGTIEGSENVTQMLRGIIGALPDLNAAEQDLVSVVARHAFGEYAVQPPPGLAILVPEVEFIGNEPGLVHQEGGGERRPHRAACEVSEVQSVPGRLNNVSFKSRAWVAANVNRSTLRSLNRHAVTCEQAATIRSGERTNERALDMRINAHHDLFERTLPPLAVQHWSGE